MSGNSIYPKKQVPYIFSTTFGAPIDDRTTISSIDNLAAEVPEPLRYKGLMIYVDDLNRIYWFKNGITDLHFVEFNSLYSVTSLSAIDTELPANTRFLGQLVYVQDLTEYYWFKDDIGNAVEFVKGNSAGAILIDVIILNGNTEYQHNLDSKNILVTVHENDDDMIQLCSSFHLGRVDNSIYPPIDAEEYRHNYVTIRSTLQNRPVKIKILTI